MLRHVVDKNKNLVYLDGELKLTQPESEFECPGPLQLFGAYHGGVDGYKKSKAKVYSIKIYDNDTLTREFIPCYKENADGSINKVGLYDLVTNSFYANRGTGDFTIPTDADGNPIVIDMKDIVLNRDTDTQNKTNIKAYIRWSDNTENQMDNIADTKYTLQNNTVNFNVEAVFTQYTETEEVE